MLLLLVGPALLLEGQPYFVHGTMKATSYSAADEAERTATWDFSVAVSNLFWRVDVHYGAKRSAVYASDGRMVVSCLDDGSAQGFGALPGDVVEGNYPLTASYHVTAPWYALVFRPEFLRQQLPTPFMPWQMAPAVGPFAGACRLSLADDQAANTLCRRIEFLYSAEALHRAAESLPFVRPAGTPPTPSIVPPPEGTVMGVYERIEFVSALGVKFPKRFRLTHAHNATEGTGNERARLEIVGELDSIRVPTAQELRLPAPGLPVWVTDYRFADRATARPGIQYTVRNGEWLDAASPTLKVMSRQSSHPLWQALRLRALRVRSVSGFRELFVGLVLCAAVVLAMRHYRSQRKRGEPRNPDRPTSGGVGLQ